MKIENTTAQMRKGILEFCILSLISGKDLYTTEILDTLKKGKMLVVICMQNAKWVTVARMDSKLTFMFGRYNNAD